MVNWIFVLTLKPHAWCCRISFLLLRQHKKKLKQSSFSHFTEFSKSHRQTAKSPSISASVILSITLHMLILSVSFDYFDCEERWRPRGSARHSCPFIFVFAYGSSVFLHQLATIGPIEVHSKRKHTCSNDDTTLSKYLPKSFGEGE